jgi:hypothetical protein
MSISQITNEVLALPEADRVELARIVTRITTVEENPASLQEGVRRLEESLTVR